MIVYTESHKTLGISVPTVWELRLRRASVPFPGGEPRALCWEEIASCEKRMFPLGELAWPQNTNVWISGHDLGSRFKLGTWVHWARAQALVILPSKCEMLLGHAVGGRSALPDPVISLIFQFGLDVIPLTERMLSCFGRLWNVGLQPKRRSNFARITTVRNNWFWGIKPWLKINSWGLFILA